MPISDFPSPRVRSGSSPDHIHVGKPCWKFFLPAVSRSSDKYESTPATGSLYFVIFGRMVGLVAVSHSEAAPDRESPPAASRGHIGACRDRNRGKSCLFQISLAPGSVRVSAGSHRQTLLEGFLPAVSRSSDKYESTPATGSLYFVIFGRTALRLARSSQAPVFG
jgi:hypothetical protein